MIDIKDTSSIFQLAFGLNAVILVIYQNSYQKRKELLDYVASEIKKHDKNANINIYSSFLYFFQFLQFYALFIF